MQLFPGQRIIVVTDAEEAAKAQDRIGNAAAALFENDALDRADMLAVGAVNTRAFHLVAGDQARRILDIGVLSGAGFLMHHVPFLLDFPHLCHV